MRSVDTSRGSGDKSRRVPATNVGLLEQLLVAQWGGQGESQDEDRKHLLWLCYNKASAFVVCSRSVDCRSIAIAQSSRHNDEDGSDGQPASGPEVRGTKFKAQ